jgi:hypothetical protein
MPLRVIGDPAKVFILEIASLDLRESTLLQVSVSDDTDSPEYGDLVNLYRVQTPVHQPGKEKIELSDSQRRLLSHAQESLREKTHCGYDCS